MASRLADGLDGGTSGDFRAKYGKSPDLFVQDCINFPAGKAPTEYQLDILRNFYERRRTAVRGPHGLGKSALASWLVLWAVLTSEDVKVITTASAWRQLTKYLWPEIHKWGATLRWDYIGRPPFNNFEMQVQALKLGPTIEAFAIASANAAFIEGAHAQRILFVFDEAKAIPDPTWDAAEGAFSNAWGDSGNEALALAISTPGDTNGRFYDICRRAPGLQHWSAMHIKKERVIAAGQMTQEWADNLKAQWGATDSRYLNRVEGEFSSSQTNSVIPLEWAEAAVERWYNQLDVWGLEGIYDRAVSNAEVHKFLLEQTTLRMGSLGADVAISGDKTVLAPRFAKPTFIAYCQEFVPSDFLQATSLTASEIMRIQDENGRPVAIVDADGVGVGVSGLLRTMRYPFYPFHAAAQSGRLASDGTEFLNDRAAAWWGLREALDPTFYPSLCLPDNAILLGDLTAPTWWRTPSNKIQIEPKDEIRERIGRSTDYGDAVIMALWTDKAFTGGIHV